MEFMKYVYEFFGSGIDQHLGVALKVLGSALAVFMVIPGDQPDRFLQGLVNLITSYSKKPGEKKEESDK